MVFLLCAYVTVYMIYWKFRKTFDIENDTFRLVFLLVPVTGLSFLVNYSYTPMEVGLSPKAGLPPSTLFGHLGISTMSLCSPFTALTSTPP